MVLIEPVAYGWDLAVASEQRVAFTQDAERSVLAGVPADGGPLVAIGKGALPAAVPDGSSGLDRRAAALGRPRG